jgi:hypothetical protein
MKKSDSEIYLNFIIPIRNNENILLKTKANNLFEIFNSINHN